MPGSLDKAVQRSLSCCPQLPHSSWGPAQPKPKMWGGKKSTLPQQEKGLGLAGGRGQAEQQLSSADPKVGALPLSIPSACPQMQPHREPAPPLTELCPGRPHSPPPFLNLVFIFCVRNIKWRLQERKTFCLKWLRERMELHSSARAPSAAGWPGGGNDAPALLQPENKPQTAFSGSYHFSSQPKDSPQTPH